ncbi:SPFH domain-containing protein [Succinivibrio sp.]|uniref:SPFH domain-containing protein n=1 Tax=Succinivibrio sp. TaxID=2053619 RepID=UPI0038676AE6
MKNEKENKINYKLTIIKNIDLSKKFYIIVGALLFVFIVYKNAYIIDQGEKAVVTNFGEISSTWNAGLHFKVPVVQSVKRYSVRVQKSVFGTANGGDGQVLSAYSNDQQIIESYTISITWNYDPARIEDVYRHFGTSDDNSVFETVVSPTIQQTSKALFGQYTAQTIVQDRAKLDTALEKKIKEQLQKYPINLISVQIVDINFSKSYENVIEQTAQKKQEIEKARNELKRIEIESQHQVAKAEAANKATRLKADAEAYQITVRAKAEADAIRLKAEALKANPALVELNIAEKWNGTVPQTVVTSSKGGNLLPLLNLNNKQ